MLDVFKARLHMPRKEIIDLVRRGYKCFINRDLAYKIKRLAHGMLHGSMKKHYGLVESYYEALKETLWTS